MRQQTKANRQGLLVRQISSRGRARVVALAVLLVAVMAALVIAKLRAAAVAAEGEHAKDLAQRSIALNLTAPNDDDFSDLEPLAKAIGDRRFVFVSEVDHYAAAAFEARCRLARFLHHRLGFNVICFERSFYAIDQLDRALESAESLELFFVWHEENMAKRMLEVHRPLLDDAVATRTVGGGKGPIHVMGVSTYYATDHGLVDEIESLFAKAAVEPPAMTPQEWDEFRAVMDTLSLPRGARLTDSRAAAAREAVQPMEEFARRLAASVEQNRAELERSLGRDRAIWLDCLIESLPSYVAAMMMGSVIDPARNANEIEERDRAWARLIIRAAEERFPGQKFVVFAAPSHLLRRSEMLPSIRAAGVANMGMVLDQQYGEQIYAIHLAVYGGTSGSGAPIPPAPAGSIAEMLHRTGDPCRILDLSTLPQDHWMRRRPSRLDRNQRAVIWSEVVDGILYIERERPL